ncbi:MAG: tetratricopeptide repeat protein [Gammaproteobacteria bacterium]|nr:tetratricopeptide repeat protein [Gammaproteobacteria bacterium]
MPDEKKNESSGTLFAEFKRRKVVQTAVGYAVISWIAVQVADVILPAYNAPDWALQALITVLIVGFPPALILTWLYNLTPGGVTLTADSPRSARLNAKLRSGRVRIALIAATMLLTGAAVWAVWHTYLKEQRSWIQIVDENKTPVVAVASISNLSGDQTLDWLGDGVSSLVRDRLAQSRHLIVVSQSRWRTIARGAGSGELLELASDADIDFLVSGEILSAPDGLILTTRVTDCRTGTDLKSEADEQLTPVDVLRSVYGISIMTKQALKKPYEEQIDSFAADFAVGNFAAYRAYVSGLKFFLNFDYKQAEQSMRAALELAPDFYVARYRMAMIHWVTGERDKAAEAMRQIPEDAVLSQREEGYVRAAIPFIRDNDPAKAIGLYQKLLEQFPYEVEARQYLAEAYFHDYQEDLAIKELKILSEQEPENQFVWGSMGAYLTLLGQHEEAMAPLKRYLEIAPEEPNAHNLMGDLHREMGRFDEATGYFEQALALEPNFTLSRLGLAEVKAVVGEMTAAKQRLRAVLDDEQTEAEDRITAAFDLAWILRAEADHAGSSAVVEGLQTAIANEQVRESMALSLRAENTMQMGQEQKAMQLVAQAVEKSMRAPTRYLFARALMEIQQGATDSARGTIGEIRGHALPPDDPDRTEDKAALYLEGLLALQAGNSELARATIEQAIAMEGYRYAIYKRSLAEALHRSGNTAAAISLAAQASKERDGGDIRLDLERDRALARQLEIRLRRYSGDQTGANKLLRDYQRRWGGAGLAGLQPAVDAVN